MTVTLGEDLEDMTGEANPTKGDIQKLRTELKCKLGVVKKHLGYLVKQWEEIQALAEGHGDAIPPSPRGRQRLDPSFFDAGGLSARQEAAKAHAIRTRLTRQEAAEKRLPTGLA